MSFLGGLFGLASPDECDWHCDECDAYLNDQPGFTTVTGEWICTECGAVNDVTEDNIRYDECSDDDIPEGCSACGGPYPNCKDSCPMFDD